MVCDSDLRSAGSVHSLCFWIHMHSIAVFLRWAPPCPHSHHETAAVQRMLCDLKHVYTDIRFTEIPMFTVHCKFTRIITYLSLLLHEEVSSADEPGGGQSCTSEWGWRGRGFHYSMHWREEWLHQRRQHSPGCIHIVAINACLCREKEQNKGINTVIKEKVIYIHQRHVPGEV